MRKNRKSILCLLLFALLSLTACGTGASRASNEVVLKIDGNDITRSEYMVYLYTTTQSFLTAAGTDVWNMDFDGQTADELVEDRTISTLQSVIAAKAYAAEHGISLTEEQKGEAKQAADDFLQTVPAADLEKMGVDEKVLYPMMEESYLYSMVYEEISAECEVDPEQMAAYYQENKDRVKEDYTQLKLNTVLLDDAAKAEEAAKKARAGEDFAALFAEYDVDTTAKESEDGGEMTLYQSYLKTAFGVEEDLETGDIAGPLAVGENYFLLQVAEKTVPTDAEVKTLAEDAYRNNVRTEYAEGRIEEMLSEQTVEKVESLWETLEKFH